MGCSSRLVPLYSKCGQVADSGLDSACGFALWRCDVEDNRDDMFLFSVAGILYPAGMILYERNLYLNDESSLAWRLFGRHLRTTQLVNLFGDQKQEFVG